MRQNALLMNGVIRKFFRSRHRVTFSKLLSEPACSSQVDLQWASLHLPWGMQSICGPFFRIYLCLSRDFVNQHVFFCCSISIEIAQNSHEECNEFEDLCFEDYHYAFQETLCPVTLAHIRSLYFIQVYTFIPLINSAPFLCFSHILLFTNFFLCTLPRKILFLSLMTLLPRI